MASFTDDFNRSNATDLGAGWVEVSGDWSIVSQQLSPGAAGGTIILRAAGAMASNDHYAQVTIAATTTASQGVWCRGNSNISQGYLLRNNGSSWDLFSVVGGSFTVIGTYAVAAAAGDVAKVQAVGSAIKGLINGVERISVTNTAVTTGTSVGIRSDSAGAIRYDDFAAADITAGATLGIASSVDTAQALTGAKAATLAVAAASDSAQPMAGAKTGPLTPAEEVAAAQPLSGAKTTPLTPPGQVDAAQALTGAKAGGLGIASMVEAAQPIAGTKTGILTPAVEVDAAQVLTAAETETGTLGTANTVETAQPLAGVKTATLTPALEVDAARPVSMPSTIVPSRYRTYKVPAEPRRLAVAAEHRTLTVRR
ncbi:hypothetical protein [Streptomyces sp. NPDC008092]|uniref:hypothetical protein n=1 Tax=Streptomyces sp. NPDC008092 TaxID=3364808 RepID=UPI0036E02F0A